MSQKTERILKLIALLLTTRRPLTRHEIQERVEGYAEDPDSFRKTFERDKAILRDELDVPLEMVEMLTSGQPETGYIIRGDRYRLADPGLEPDELAAINLAASRVRLGAVDPASGLQKLGTNAGHRTAADELATLPESPHVPVVFQAFRQESRLQFSYNNEPRDVDPFRLHVERGRWYLQGHDHGRGDARTFRLDRIEGDIVVGAPKSATAPMPDNLRKTPQLRGWAAGEDDPVIARVRIDADQVPVAERMVDDSTTIIHADDGSAVFEMEVRRHEGIRAFVLGFLGAAELLEPQSLRDDLVTWLESIANGGKA